MNKNHWLTILLDGSVEFETVCGLIEQSFDMTTPKLKKKK
jgi:predicted DNA-binding protein (MmcQ/YjbR family)